MAPAGNAYVFCGMTTPNSFAFLIVGLAMYVLPGVFPQYFPNSATLANTSALWLQCMAPIQAAVGVRFIFLNEVLPLWQMISEWHIALEWHPMTERETISV
jgi:hypothetical protein